MVLAGGDADVEELKQSLVSEAVRERLRDEAPEVFRPGTDAALRIVSDYDVDV